MRIKINKKLHMVQSQQIQELHQKKKRKEEEETNNICNCLNFGKKQE
jgi:hypothetical protein